MPTISPPPRIQFFKADGSPLANGKLYTYQAGTTTLKETYTNSTGLAANTNPIILDVSGSASVWLGYGKYDYALYDEDDVLQYTQSGLGDPLPTSYVLEGIAGSNTIVADSAEPPLEEYVPFMTARFIAAANNTGATTINIAGLGAKTIAKDGTDALESGDIVQGALTTINYDGTRFQLLSEAQSIPAVALSCSGNSATATYADTAATATYADTAGSATTATSATSAASAANATTAQNGVASVAIYRSGANAWMRVTRTNGTYTDAYLGYVDSGTGFLHLV